MSITIKKLAPEVASRIAAGEVAERPFNVVKELIENSVDAGANKITVEIADGGLSLVRITDNGKGISEEDLPIALERFATSKAVSVEDVYNASTFGFRGEALAAISAVSDFTITSGIDDGRAFQVHSLFGQIGDVKPAPPIKGTVMEAINLFENVPARRKFLKSFKSLENEITKLIKQFSLINNDVDINLIIDGKEVYAVLNREDMTLRASKVFPGKGFYKGEVDYSGTKVIAVATLPSQSDRLKRDAIIIGVNGRLIKDPSLVQAVIRAYYRLIPDGKYPCAAIDIRITPSEVDANVHPSKMEVRFENQKEIFSLVSDAVAKAFSGKGVNVSSVYSTISGSSSIKFDNLPTLTEEDLAFKGTPDRQLPPISGNLENFFGDNNFEVQKDSGVNVSKEDMVADSFKDPFDVPVEEFLGTKGPVNSKPTYALNIENFSANSGKIQVESNEDTFERKVASGDFKILGQIDNSYIVCETEDKNVLFIDQHAAHERILFEKNQSKNLKGAKATIILHRPMYVEITDEVAEDIENFKATINGFGYGFDLNPDKQTVTITRIPFSAAKRDVKKEFLRIVYDLCLSGKSKTEDAPRAMLSCKSAVKAGDPLTVEEMGYLIKLLFSTDNFGTCPHGRPIIYAMSVAELARKFLR